MPEEEVTRLEANLAQDEAAAVRVVRVVHPQHGVTPETGELSQEVRARHGRRDHVHDVEASHQRVQARAEARSARNQELHCRERPALAGTRRTNALQQAASKTPHGVGVHAAGHQARVQARDAAHVRRLDAPATLHIPAR